MTTPIPTETPAPNPRPNRWRGVVVAVLALLVLDQLTKWIAIQTLRGHPTQSFLFDTFRLTYAENSGVFLGLGGNLPPAVRFGLFTIAVGAVLVVMLSQTLKAHHSEKWMVVSLTLIVAGGFGNLIDRLIRSGVVVDFMNMGIGGLRTGIFNVADMCITAGVFVFVGYEIARGRKTPEAK